jgi:NAD(P)-dependent dehydrogenase (short-subunit alcohol dehydrogenase family)
MTTQWDGSTMPSMRGKRVVVTGANQGLGFATAQRLALRGAHVVLACRNEARGREAITAIREALAAMDDPAHEGGEVELMLVDMGEMASVKRFADALRAKFDRLDVLVNNAGVGGALLQEWCADGYCVQFGVNYLGHFYLTTLVMDLLRAAPEARVVSVSSISHRQDLSRALYFPDTSLNFETLAYGTGDNSLARYEKSKLCVLLFALELDRRLQAAGIHNVRSVASHPGVCYTSILISESDNVFRSCINALARLYYSLYSQTADMGALSILYAATMPDAKGGQYYGPDGPSNWYGYPALEEPHATARSETLAQQLWDLSEKLTKTPFKLV